MKKKITSGRWVENTSVTDNVRNFQGQLNRGSSAGKVVADLPPSNRKERRILAQYKRKKRHE